MPPPTILPGSSASPSASANAVTAQPVLSRSLQTSISTMQARCNKVLTTAAPLSSPDLPAARAAVTAVVIEASAGASPPLPTPLREVLSGAINPPMQSLAKKCHGIEHYSLLLAWLYELSPLLTEASIALEWWDFLIKPVLRNMHSSETALAQARSLVLEAICTTPANEYEDVPAPRTPWPAIENNASFNFARKVGDAPYSTFASGPAPHASPETVRTPGSSVGSGASPTVESSLTAYRRRAPAQKNALYRFAQRIVQIYFSETASTPHIERKRTRTRNSSGASPGHLQAMTAVTVNTNAGDGVSGDQSTDSDKAARDLSGLGLTGMNTDEGLPQSLANGLGSQDKPAQQGAGHAEHEEEEEEEEPDEPSICWTQRLEGIILEFGTRAPKRFFHHLAFCFSEPTYRIPVLVNLIAFISEYPATAYHVIPTQLPAEVLMSLQIDTSTMVVSLGVRLVVMLLPHIPTWFANGGGGGLPALMAIFARVIDWRIFGNGWEERVGTGTSVLGSEDGGSAAGDSALLLDTSSQGEDGPGVSAVSLADEIINKKAALDIEWMELDRIGKRLELREDVEWLRLTSKYDGPDTAAPNATLLFTYLYGLFPANTIRFLRAPIDYLRKAHYVSPSAASFEDLIDEITIQERSSEIVRQHRLHDGLVLHSAEWEVCSTDRWKKSATEECAAVCVNHFLGPSEGGPENQRSNLAAQLAERFSPRATRSGADTPVAHQDSLHSGSMLSVAMKPSLSAATMLTPALSISSSKGMSAVHRENLMLRTELNYELNLKSQLLNFIGKLHTNKVYSHITAAELQNLKSEVKVLRSELDRSRKERDKIREEADKRAKRLGNPQQRLRTYMEKDRQATEQLQKLSVELQSKEETNVALSTQLEAVGTELFELKAVWQQNEPALKELESLKAHVENMQNQMKAWADNEVRYTALDSEMRTMASKWAQLELERDHAEAAAREAIEAREAAEVEREKWEDVAQAAAAQLKSLQEKWNIKPPTPLPPAAAPSTSASTAHPASLTPTAHAHMHASGAVFSASSPSSPMLQPTERASRRQSMVQAASARLLAGNSSAASALLQENVRLTSAMEEMQAEMLALRAQLALARTAAGGSNVPAAATAGSGAVLGTPVVSSSAGSSAFDASRLAAASRAAQSADLEDIDVLPLDIGPAAQNLSDVQEVVEPVGESPSSASTKRSEGCPEYVFTTLRILGGSVGEEDGEAALVQRLLPPQLRALYSERAAQQAAAEVPEYITAELQRRIPLVSQHLERLEKSAASMRALWPNEWSTPASEQSDLASRAAQALVDELGRQETVLLGQPEAAPSDLRVRVGVDRTGAVKVTSALTAHLIHDQTDESNAAQTTRRPTVRVDTQSTNLFGELDEARADAMASCKTSERGVYVAAAARLSADYGIGGPGQEVNSCFDGLLWTSLSGDGAEGAATRLLTESTIANIVLEVQGPDGASRFLTPALQSKDGLRFLPGLLRTQLVGLGLVEEADIPVEQILALLTQKEDEEQPQAEGADRPVRLWLCNALRGLFEVELVPSPNAAAA
ncbi:hypothetical protein OC835_007314 [Tilletia horrida]|nr:hypothetical protein OC835_007314 [Tilletia horrida]